MRIFLKLSLVFFCGIFFSGCGTSEKSKDDTTSSSSFDSSVEGTYKLSDRDAGNDLEIIIDNKKVLYFDYYYEDTYLGKINTQKETITIDEDGDDLIYKYTIVDKKLVLEDEDDDKYILDRISDIEKSKSINGTYRLSDPDAGDDLEITLDNKKVLYLDHYREDTYLGKINTQKEKITIDEDGDDLIYDYKIINNDLVIKSDDDDIFILDKISDGEKAAVSKNSSSESEITEKSSTAFSNQTPPETENAELDSKVKELSDQYDELTDRAKGFTSNPDSFTQDARLQFLQDQNTILATFNEITEQLDDNDSSSYIKVLTYIQNKNIDYLEAVSKLPED